jgi:hypothetical protein
MANPPSRFVCQVRTTVQCAPDTLKAQDRHATHAQSPYNLA